MSKVLRSYCVVLNEAEKATLLNVMNRRIVDEKWSDDIFF